MTRTLTRNDQEHRTAIALAGELGRRLELGSVPTIDGRVVVYAPADRGAEFLAATQKLIQGLSRTARIVSGGDDRLAVIEVSRAGR